MDLSSIIKSYDVRGIYPNQINEDAVYALARGFVSYINASSIAVGRDCRTSSPSLHNAFMQGVCDSGADIYDLGEITTPMLYFAVRQLNVDGGSMITASHNPPEYNGIKFTDATVSPIGKRNGLQDIQHNAEQHNDTPVTQLGIKHSVDIQHDWHNELQKHEHINDTTFSIIADTGNMMGAHDLDVYRNIPTIKLSTLFETIDGSMPNHEANPLNTTTLTDLQEAVTKESADIGIAYDGDADRIGFVDETGSIIQPHYITALLARYTLQKYPQSIIAFDVPSSRSVQEEIERCGGIALMTQVGTANIKHMMREKKARFGGEFSGHYYFSDYQYSEAPTRVALYIMNMLASEHIPLSELVASVTHYAHSGEINFPINPTIDKTELLKKYKQHYNDGKQTVMDGIRVDYDDWWFLIRPSNTEPIIRMVVEASDIHTMEEKKKELIQLMH